MGGVQVYQSRGRLSSTCVQGLGWPSGEETGCLLSFPVSLAGVLPNPPESLWSQLRNSVHLLLLSALWLLLTHAFYSRRLKEVVRQSKTFFEGGAVLFISGTT